MHTQEIFKNIKNIKIDHQVEFEQTGVWFDLYDKPVSICYQNGDMSGNKKGEAVWNNDGADTGPDEILEVLKNREEYQSLVDNTTYWKYEALKDLIADFLNEFSEKHGIDTYIASFQDE